MGGGAILQGLIYVDAGFQKIIVYGCKGGNHDDVGEVDTDEKFSNKVEGKDLVRITNRSIEEVLNVGVDIRPEHEKSEQ